MPPDDARYDETFGWIDLWTVARHLQLVHDCFHWLSTCWCTEYSITHFYLCFFLDHLDYISIWYATISWTFEPFVTCSWSRLCFFLLQMVLQVWDVFLVFGHPVSSSFVFEHPVSSSFVFEHPVSSSFSFSTLWHMSRRLCVCSKHAP